MTSRDSFNTIYQTAGTGAGSGVEELVDFGSHIRPGDAAPPSPACTDPNDQCPVDACDPSDVDCVDLQVAVNDGPPAGTCSQTDGANSMPVGATLGSLNKNGVVSVRSVVDINTVNGLDHLVPVNQVTVAADWKPIGWIYLDQNGGRWFQKDAQAQWTYAMQVNVNQYLGFSFTPPIAETAKYVPGKPTSSTLNNDIVTTKCFSKGRALVPGAWG